MATLQRPVLCRPNIHAKHARFPYPSINLSLSTGGRPLTSRFWGSSGKCKFLLRASSQCSSRHERKSGSFVCSFSSSSDGNDSMAENFGESDENYVNSSVIEAVEVKCNSDGFLIKMRDGSSLKCVHNSPQRGYLPDYAPHPAIVLKAEDGSGLLLPIVVLEMPSILLMAAVRNVKIPRPTIYKVVCEMVDKMGYQVQCVRVTKRVHEAYFSELYLTKAGNGNKSFIFDVRPSDAVNLAVRCKVPIQVNKNLVYSDGMKVIEPSKVATQSERLLFTELDRPDGQPCLETKEFDIVRNMLIAAVEERYRDAAQWKDKLEQLRAKRKN